LRVIESGIGELIQPPDLDGFREWNREKKSRALVDFEEETAPTQRARRMRLLSTHPGVTIEQVVENTGFELIIPDEVGQNEPPTAEELHLLRKEIDPEGFYI